MNNEQYNKLKRRVDAAKSEADRAAGVYTHLMEKLKAEYGCDTLKEAEARLVELEKEATNAEEAYDGAHERFLSEWEEFLPED